MKIATRARAVTVGWCSRRARLAFSSVFVATSLAGSFLALAQPDVVTLSGGRTSAGGADSGFVNGNTSTQAQFNNPFALALDSTGNLLFVADRANNAVRRLDLAGNTTTTFATGFNQPVALALDSAGNLYVVNQGSGTVVQFNAFGNLVGDASSALATPTAIAVDGSGILHVAELGGGIWRGPAGSVTNFTTVAIPGVQLRGIAVLDNGNIAVSDAGTHALKLVHPVTGAVTHLAGSTDGTSGTATGGATFARFNQPHHIAKAGGSALVVADRLNHRVQVVSATGNVTNLYGISSANWISSRPGWRDGSSDVAEAREPVGVLVAANGDVYTTEIFYHLIRQVTGTGLTGPSSGGGGGGGDVVVAAPTISPNSGYFPMGQRITVSSASADVFYTTDGTDPTTNSLRVTMSGNLGTILWNTSTNDLTALRVRAFSGETASEVVSGLPASSNTIGVPAGINGSIYAGIGSTIVLPVVMNLRENEEIRSFQFRVEITPDAVAVPEISDQFEPLAISPADDFVPVITVAQGEDPATFDSDGYYIAPSRTRGLWISAVGADANVSFQGFAVAAMLKVLIPDDALEGGTYSVNVLHASATSDAQQTTVPLTAMTPMTILVTNVAYTVGDSARGVWYNAGDFGNGNLDNADVNNAFAAASGVRVPYDFTDIYDAMDAYPEDSAVTGVGGDGTLEFNDWQTILFRSLRLPPYTDGAGNWQRSWSAGGVRINTGFTLPSANLPAAELAYAPGDVWHRQAAISAVGVEWSQPGSQVEVPVYVRVAPGATISGLQFRAIVQPVGDAPALAQKIQFVPAAGIPNPLTASGRLNEIACGWRLGSFNLSERSSHLLGRIRMVIPATAQSGQCYAVQFANSGGGQNLETPYRLETRRACVWVGSAGDGHADSVISDDWKIHFFGAVDHPSAHPDADPDGDGIPNWREFLAGTNPTEALSRLHLQRAELRANAQQRELALQWLSAPGKVYVLEAAPDLSGGNWTILGTVPGNGNVQEFIETNISDDAQFYRIRVLH